MTVWYDNIMSDEHARLNSIIRTASKIIGATIEPLEEIYKKRCDRKIKCVLKCTDHPAKKIFKVLPPGKRFMSFKSKTKRLSHRFYVRAAWDMKPVWLYTVHVCGSIRCEYNCIWLPMCVCVCLCACVGGCVCMWLCESVCVYVNVWDLLFISGNDV